MPELSGRNLHLVKKALAIAVASMERMPEGPFRSGLGYGRYEDAARRDDRVGRGVGPLRPCSANSGHRQAGLMKRRM